MKINELLNELITPSPISTIKIGELTISIKRDELNHPIISGNKWRKLKFNLSQYSGEGILSFGGAFSNHLHALAYCCWKMGIPFRALIRGESAFASNPTIKDLIKWKTRIEWQERSIYQKRHDPNYIKDLQKKWPKWTIIPEGGSNKLALLGIQELAEEIMIQFPKLENLVLPVGSGGSIAGLIKALPKSILITGISVTKEDYLEQMINDFLDDIHSNWRINREYHMGGFGRCPEELRAFMKQIYQKHQILLDPVYNSKGLFAFIQLLKKGLLPNDEKKTLYLHTGGLQGIKGYQYLYPNLLQWLD